MLPFSGPNRGYELAGFVWFQGFNDLVDGWSYPNQNQPGGYDEYSQLLANLIRDVRKDLSAPQMPFVIGVMGIDGMKDVKPSMAHFRQAMAAPASLLSSKATWWRCRRRPYGTTIWPHCKRGRGRMRSSRRRRRNA